VRWLAVALLLVVSACTDQAAPAPAPCAVVDGPLPAWARAGFTPPDQAVPHVVGTGGDIVGVLFGQPMTVPPRSGANNKILWVSRVDGAGEPLRIHATLAGSAVAVDRAVTVGPSVVDLPQTGCWTFSLSWSGHHDEVSVRYYPKEAGP
jgi:hypothetical protein